MNKVSEWWNNYKIHAPFTIIIIVMLVLGTWLTVGWYQFQLNPDAASYFTIADKYAHGDIRHAINGYWGPLLSWLLVPAVWLGANMIISAKLILLLASAALMITLYRFLLGKGVSRLITNITLFGLAGLFTTWSTAGPVTPDILMALLVVWFSLIFVRFLKTPTHSLALQLGAIGGVMYFAKGFGFFLFLGTVGIVAMWQWLREKQNFGTVFRRWLPAGIIFFALTLPFIGVLTLKYDKPTINNAGLYDHHIYGPIGQAVSPMINNGPLQPPTDSAMSVWEDPTPMTHMVPGWTPFDNWDHMGYFWSSVIGRNLNNGWHATYNLGPFVALGISALVLGVMQPRNRFRRELRFFAGISVLMIAGYSLVLIDGRYLWGSVAMAVAAGALMVSIWQQKKMINGPQILVGGILLVGITLLINGQYVVANRDLDKQWYMANTALRPYIAKGSNIISDDFSGSFFACHHLKLRCFSIMNPPIENTDPYYKTLKDMKIEYFVDYHMRSTNKDMYRFVNKHFDKIAETNKAGIPITVYRIK
ncbi:MAG TPA: hypothetical protein VF733_01765 [Candidatus Saccharimonadales bacterium]